ncbi:MAG: phenylalanine--tRNA ligase subunit alpha [Ruminococcaceae bacterium]|nr:phenylalanine--tRNA ligase subunit alpha [Oscillospiraceae bacterium]
MKDKLQQIRLAAKDELNNIQNPEELEQLKVKYLGKKGELTAILRSMSTLSAEERPVIGQFANEVRADIEKFIEEKRISLADVVMKQKLKAEKIDVTIPGKKRQLGHTHPLTATSREIEKIFLSMGFDVLEGPEIEYVSNNFDALNAPDNHPSRDLTDTFYINPEILLRTQTSPMQARIMRSGKPPIRVVCPGRVYRSDEVDATHSPMFHQMEGLVVDKNIVMGDLKGTLEVFAKSMFGEDARIRFRPHHFPFTEPSAEVDISCFVCGGKGCRVCKGEGWIEILGAGMVHPNVLRNCGIDPEEYSGFAFGLGIERVAMRRYNIDDMRLLYENDMRFLSQF